MNFQYVVLFVTVTIVVSGLPRSLEHSQSFDAIDHLSSANLEDATKGEHDRSKRYVVRKKRWHKNQLTWKLELDNIGEEDVFIVRNTLHRAFNEWQGVSSVRFMEVVDGKVDLTVSFQKKAHEDPYPFDGKDGVVAHAFYPRDGRLHFDADEDWTLNSYSGVNLYQTAVHEIGHLLGLEHSGDPRAAMYAMKRPFMPDFTLGDDDVRAVRELFPLDEKTSKAGMKNDGHLPSIIVENLEKEPAGLAQDHNIIMIEKRREPFKREQPNDFNNMLFPFTIGSLDLPNSNKKFQL